VENNAFFTEHLEIYFNLQRVSDKISNLQSYNFSLCMTDRKQLKRYTSKFKYLNNKNNQLSYHKFLINQKTITKLFSQTENLTNEVDKFFVKKVKEKRKKERIKKRARRRKIFPENFSSVPSSSITYYEFYELKRKHQKKKKNNLTKLFEGFMFCCIHS